MSFTSEPGAPPSNGFVPLSVPEVRGNEWQYIKDCIDTGWVSSVGSYVDRFERDLAEAVGAKYAVAAVNGSAALHIGHLLAGVQPGDEVLCSDITFIASANSIRYAFAHPVFIDCRKDTWQIDPDLVKQFLTEECERRDGGVYNKKSGRRIGAIMPVHILGTSVDLDPILATAKEFGIPVVEDAAEALGSVYKGKRVGSFDTTAACFSFNGNKILTTGGGGMIVTNDEAIAKRAKFLTTQAKDHPVEYIHSEVGYNYRLPNLLAAMGCAQLELLDEYLAKKKQIAKTYEEGLKDVDGITVMPNPGYGDSSFWLYTILIDKDVYGETWRDVMVRLQEAKIQTRPLWEPMHLSRAHSESQFYGHSVSESLYSTALSLPCSVGLTDSDQDRVINALRRESQ